MLTVGSKDYTFFAYICICYVAFKFNGYKHVYIYFNSNTTTIEYTDFFFWKKSDSYIVPAEN